MVHHKKNVILGITGTRADFGKLKGIFRLLEERENIELHVLVTGMHLLRRYGYTLNEVKKENYTHILPFVNQYHEEPMESILGNTIVQISKTIHEIQPSMVFVHGDRIEAMAGAIAGAIGNVRVCHIEGGELSGTIDDLIRHSVSKLAHVHLVANEDASNRLIKMGENIECIHTIGSPDLDIMLSSSLPTISEVKDAYAIDFENYAVSIFHPVTTEYDTFKVYADNYLQALIKSDKKYVVIYPNNDLGAQYIFDSFSSIKSNSNFRLIPSMRFEFFLSLLKYSDFVIGNSSAGIREAPFYGVPVINVGTRQDGRTEEKIITNTNYECFDILSSINSLNTSIKINSSDAFGVGNSISKFSTLLDDPKFWSVPLQKKMTY